MNLHKNANFKAIIVTFLIANLVLPMGLQLSTAIASQGFLGGLGQYWGKAQASAYTGGSCDARSKGYFKNNDGCQQGQGESIWASEVRALSTQYFSGAYASVAGGAMCVELAANCQSDDEIIHWRCKLNQFLMADEMNVVSGRLQLDALAAGADTHTGSFERLGLNENSTVQQVLAASETIMTSSAPTSEQLQDAATVTERLYAFYESQNSNHPACVFPPRAVCNNGVLEAGEQCDGTLGVGAHQRCTNQCVLENVTYCGDGTVQNPNDAGVAEQCDAGAANGTNPSTCSAECRQVHVEIPVIECGNGIVETGEQCDDANTNDTDDCRNTCTSNTALMQLPLQSCTGTADLYLYKDNQFHDIDTHFTVQHNQLIVFTRYDIALTVKVNGTPRTMTLERTFTSPFPVKVYSLNTNPGDSISIEGENALGARTVQGYLSQDSSAPAFALPTLQIIFDGAQSNTMYLNSGTYSYFFLDKYSKNNDGSDDSRNLSVTVSGPAGQVVNQSYTKPAPTPSQGAVVGSYSIPAGQAGTYTLNVTTEDSIYWPLAQCPQPPQPVCGNGTRETGEQCDGSDGVGAHQHCTTSCQLENDICLNPIMYAVSDISETDMSFIKLDVTPHQLSTINTINGHYIEAIDMHPVTKVIYALSGRNNDGADKKKLLVLDRTTGIPAFSTGLPLDIPQTAQYQGASFNPVTNQLWVAGDQDLGLRTVNLSTGASYLEAPVSGSLEALAWNQSGTHLYFIKNNQMNKYAASNGSITPLCTFVREAEGMEFDTEGRLVVGYHDHMSGSSVPRTQIVNPETCQPINDHRYDIPASFQDVETMTFDCRVDGPVCGNGVVETEETCDEGTANGTANHCNAQCSGITTPVCGNNVVEAGEQCDGTAGVPQGQQCTAQCRLVTPETPNICGVKFNDLNHNGTQDQGESNLSGWTVQLFKYRSTGTHVPPTFDADGVEQGPQHICWQMQGGQWHYTCGQGTYDLIASAVTTAEGYCFNHLSAGTYRVMEIQQENWTAVRSQCDITLSSSTSAQCLLANYQTPTGPVCGNGIVETGEQCDGTAGVGAHQRCTNQCVLENVTYCGDGIVQNPNDEGVVEQCDGTAGTPSGSTCNAQCHLVAAPGEYALAKNRVGSGEVHRNDQVTFDLVLSNTGNVPLNHALLTDTFDSSILTFMYASPTPSFIGTSTLQWNSIPNNSIPTNTDMHVLVNFTIKGDAPATTTVNMLASTEVRDSNANTLPDKHAEASVTITIPSQGCTIDCGTTTTTGGGGGGGGGGFITPIALLTIEKTVDKISAEIGDTLNYTVVLKNVGNTAGMNLQLVDTLPTGLQFVDGGGQTKTWNLPPIGQGSTQTVTYAVLVNDKAVTGQYENRAVGSISNGNTVEARVKVQVFKPVVSGIEEPKVLGYHYLPDTGGFGVSALLLGLTFIFGIIAAAAFAGVSKINMRNLYE